MAEQTKVNPIFVNEARHFNGKSVTALTVTLGAITDPDDFSPNGPVDLALRALTQDATPILMSEIELTGGVFDIYFEGDFESMSEFGPAGDQTFAEYLTVEVDAVVAGAAVAFMDPARYGLVGDKF